MVAEDRPRSPARPGFPKTMLSLAAHLSRNTILNFSLILIKTGHILSLFSSSTLIFWAFTDYEQADLLVLSMKKCSRLNKSKAIRDFTAPRSPEVRY